MSTRSRGVIAAAVLVLVAKQRGKPRDAQRIVTGSDGSAWYTGDHYTMFVRMR